MNESSSINEWLFTEVSRYVVARVFLRGVLASAQSSIQCQSHHGDLPDEDVEGGRHHDILRARDPAQNKSLVPVRVAAIMKEVHDRT